jgi:hypothetical protein
MSVPEYIYKKEKAIINRVGNTFDMNTSRITYTVSAVSACMLGYSGSHFFPSYFGKPSELIKSLLASNKDDLKALFPGMVNSELVEQLKLIADDDKEVQLDAQENCSTMDYIKYCVENMIPTSTLDISSKVGAFYIFTVHDENEAEIIGNTNLRDLGGAYFKVSKVSKKEEHSDAYVLNLGYPSGTFVTNFSVENNENYSIFYNYAEKLDTTNYVDRVNLETGTVEKEFSPRLTSKNDRYLTTQSAQVWWTKVADYPISASITIRGLLRPALLMQYLKLNVLFYGQKHVASGLYIITKQIDEISGSGYKTTLGLTKISASTSAIIE